MSLKDAAAAAIVSGSQHHGIGRRRRRDSWAGCRLLHICLPAVDESGIARATSACHVFGDYAQVFFVNTEPAWRRRGIGSAMTLEALRAAALSERSGHCSMRRTSVLRSTCDSDSRLWGCSRATRTPASPQRDLRPGSHAAYRLERGERAPDEHLREVRAVLAARRSRRSGGSVPSAVRAAASAATLRSPSASSTPRARSGVGPMLVETDLHASVDAGGSDADGGPVLFAAHVLQVRPGRHLRDPDLGEHLLPLERRRRTGR